MAVSLQGRERTEVCICDGEAAVVLLVSTGPCWFTGFIALFRIRLVLFKYGDSRGLEANSSFQKTYPQMRFWFLKIFNEAA